MSQPLALPPPPPDGATAGFDLNTNATIKLDKLGPMVVNSDGTLSRIANWDNMTEREQQTTLRVLAKRNNERLENEKRKQEAASQKETPNQEAQ